MPLHRNESTTQKTMAFKNMDTYVKENYRLSWERATDIGKDIAGFIQQAEWLYST